MAGLTLRSTERQMQRPSRTRSRNGRVGMMKRRSFLQIGAVGGTVAALGLSPQNSRANATLTETHFDLTIDAANMELIDGTVVYTLQFFRGWDNPSPEMRVAEGEEITITLTNNDTRSHAFVIRGAPGSYISPVQPGQTGMASFKAPAGGTYLYMDGSLGPVNRLVGLHGAFIVEPKNRGRTAAGSDTPYSQSMQNPQVQALFDAMGYHERFPGEQWEAENLQREKLWLFSQIDPSLNARVAAGELIDPSTVRDNFVPRYFTINGLSGFDTAHHNMDGDPHEGRAGRIMPSGAQGQPCLLRCLNAGAANHAVHIHGNHCFQLCESDWNGKHALSDHIQERDTWHLRPLQTIDMLLPYERPPDIPKEAWPPKEEPFPLRYVMHCHFELSQTAGGGNYPQGAVTHWEMTAPL